MIHIHFFDKSKVNWIVLLNTWVSIKQQHFSSFTIPDDNINQNSLYEWQRFDYLNIRCKETFHLHLEHACRHAQDFFHRYLQPKMQPYICFFRTSVKKYSSDLMLNIWIRFFSKVLIKMPNKTAWYGRSVKIHDLASSFIRKNFMQLFRIHESVQRSNNRG
jgi:hypothetical protein